MIAPKVGVSWGCSKRDTIDQSYLVKEHGSKYTISTGFQVC